jgi:hypothetical protein
VSLKFRTDKDGCLHVDAIAPCGKEIEDVAIIYEPNSENPGLQLERPLGIAAVREIVEYIERMKLN